MRPDGRQIAVGSDDGVIRLYDPKTGRLQQLAFGQHKYTHYYRPCLAWSPDGQRLASCYEEGVLNIWNTDTGQISRTTQLTGAYSGSVAWSPDGKLLGVGSYAGVTLWDAESGKQIVFPVETGIVSSLAWSPG